MKPSTSYKSDDSQTAVIFSAEGHELSIDRASSSGTIRLGAGTHAGRTFSISDSPPASSRKLFLESQNNDVLQPLDKRRRLSTWNTFAVTNGHHSNQIPHGGAWAPVTKSQPVAAWG